MESNLPYIQGGSILVESPHNSLTCSHCLEIQTWALWHLWAQTQNKEPPPPSFGFFIDFIWLNLWQCVKKYFLLHLDPISCLICIHTLIIWIVMNFHAIFNIEILQIMKSILKQQMRNPNFYVPLVSFEKHKGIIFSNVHVIWWSSTITYVII